MWFFGHLFGLMLGDLGDSCAHGEKGALIDHGDFDKSCDLTPKSGIDHGDY